MQNDNPNFPARLNAAQSQPNFSGPGGDYLFAAVSSLKAAESWDAEGDVERGDRLRAEAQVYATLCLAVRT